jgi:hypothetical protein
VNQQKPRPIQFMQLGYSVAEMTVILERWDQMSEAERALVLTASSHPESSAALEPRRLN